MSRVGRREQKNFTEWKIARHNEIALAHRRKLDWGEWDEAFQSFHTLTTRNSIPLMFPLLELMICIHKQHPPARLSVHYSYWCMISERNAQQFMVCKHSRATDFLHASHAASCQRRLPWARKFLVPIVCEYFASSRTIWFSRTRFRVWAREMIYDLLICFLRCHFSSEHLSLHP